MRRKFTVYGLRFSKTSFWNRINTGFPDPAVATVLTVYGIETVNISWNGALNFFVATVLTVYGIETLAGIIESFSSELQQYLPFTVLKRTMKLIW